MLCTSLVEAAMMAEEMNALEIIYNYNYNTLKLEQHISLFVSQIRKHFVLFSNNSLEQVFLIKCS